MRRATFLVLCLAVAGCSDSGPKRLSATEYAARANAICAQFHRRADALARATTLPQLDKATTKTLDLFRSATRALRKLRPPADQEAAANRWLTSLDVLTADLVKLRERARANDLGGVHRVASTSLVHDSRSDTLARAVGATACAKNR